MTPNDATLLSCPFCGSEAIMDHEGQYNFCNDCASTSPCWHRRSASVIDDATIERMCKAYWSVILNDPLRSDEENIKSMQDGKLFTPHTLRCMRAAIAAMNQGGKP